jgi:hypothetical protein
MGFSEILEKYIKSSIKKYDGSYNTGDPFPELISMGELVDRLSIVNFKLYTLKDKVMESEDQNFRAWAAVEDVKLVMERARLKKAIDVKLIHMINNVLSGDSSGGVNLEVKRYGNDNKS